MEQEKIYPIPEVLKKLKPWHIAVGMIPQCEQRQDALNDQLRDLILVANKLGCYDAADYLKRVISE